MSFLESPVPIICGLHSEKDNFIEMFSPLKLVDQALIIYIQEDDRLIGQELESFPVFKKDKKLEAIELVYNELHLMPISDKSEKEYYEIKTNKLISKVKNFIDERLVSWIYFNNLYNKSSKEIEDYISSNLFLDNEFIGYFTKTQMFSYHLSSILNNLNVIK